MTNIRSLTLLIAGISVFKPTDRQSKAIFYLVNEFLEENALCQAILSLPQVYRPFIGRRVG